MDKVKRGAPQNPRKLIYILLLAILAFQFYFLLHKNSKYSDQELYEQAAESVALMKKLQCSEIISYDVCNNRKECYAIEGVQCGKTTEDIEFIQCISVVDAIPVKKMEMEPAVPKWSSAHPDSQYICSENPNNGQTYRFERFAPTDWQQKKCFDCCIKPAQSTGKDRKLSLVTLVYRETDSFNNSLISWKKNGLFDLVDEAIVYINAMNENDEIYALAKEYNLRILGTEQNIGIGKALAQLVLHAKNNLVMFLEKDWEAILPKVAMKRQLEVTKNLILSNVNGSRADAVKLRSRWRAGYPNIGHDLCIPPSWDHDVTPWASAIPIEGTEDHEWWLPHLFCNIYHFEKDIELFKKYPNRMWKCGCDEGFMCFDSGQCGWTNNPIVFKKHWFLDNFYEISQKGGYSFEADTYYSSEWVNPHWVIAQGDGFYMHHEINEH